MGEFLWEKQKKVYDEIISEKEKLYNSKIIELIEQGDKNYEG